MRPKSVKEECGLSSASDPAIQKVNMIIHAILAIYIFLVKKRNNYVNVYQVTLLAALASTVMAATVLIAALLMICKGKRTSSAARLEPLLRPLSNL